MGNALPLIVTLVLRSHSIVMHIRTLLASLLLLPLPLFACTAFVMHQEGRTFIGNNEDSWCTQGRVRVLGNVLVRNGKWTQHSRFLHPSHHRSRKPASASMVITSPMRGVMTGMPNSSARSVTRSTGSVQLCMASTKVPQWIGIIALAPRSTAACAVSSGIMWIKGHFSLYCPHSIMAKSQGPYLAPISLKCGP